MSQGLSKFACAAEISVDKDTIYEWIRVYPDFSAAVKIGEAKSLNFWEKVGIKGTVGQIPGFAQTTYKFQMMNRHGWSEKKEIDNSSSDGSMTPNINVTFS